MDGRQSAQMSLDNDNVVSNLPSARKPALLPKRLRAVPLPRAQRSAVAATIFADVYISAIGRSSFLLVV